MNPNLRATLVWGVEPIHTSLALHFWYDDATPTKDCAFHVGRLQGVMHEMGMTVHPSGMLSILQNLPKDAAEFGVFYAGLTPKDKVWLMRGGILWVATAQYPSAHEYALEVREEAEAQLLRYMETSM